MIGTTREEITELNKIDLIDYLLSTDKASYRMRKNGTIVHQKKDDFVIWKDHSYDFATTVNPYKDSIGTLRVIYGYSFMETVERLRTYIDRTKAQENEIPHYNLFD